jgi:hypothetical protein
MANMKFSKKEFHSFVAASGDRLKVMWLALSGDVLTAEESAELEKLLAAFFSERRVCEPLRKRGLEKSAS